MKYLEDTLAEQCLSKTLYPNTKIIVSRKKVEGTLLTYTNELEVKVDFSDVDPSLLENSTENENQSTAVLNESLVNNTLNVTDSALNRNSETDSLKSEKLNIPGKSSRFFRKKV